jgi:hypothetical protein
MFHEDGTMRISCKSDLVKQFENEVSPVLSLPDFDPSLKQSFCTFFTFVDSRQQIILYFSGSMHACRNIHETRRVVLYIKGVSHGFAQMVYYYFFITNRTNYSRWMSVYILDMLDLSAEIKSAFEKGEFFIRQTSPPETYPSI